MISRDDSDLSENRFCTPISHGTSSLRALLPGFKHTNIKVLVLYVYIPLYARHVVSHIMPPHEVGPVAPISCINSLSLHSLETP